MENEVLLAWLKEVLAVQCKDGVVVLSNGGEAEVEFDGDTISLTQETEEGGSEILARIRLVVS